MDQTRQEFLLELEELIEHVFTDLDELRAAPSNSQQRNLIDSIFRRVHSVKGLAATAALDNTSQTAHQFENLLAELRWGRVSVDEDVLDLCDNVAEVLSESLERGFSEPDSTLHDQIEATIARADHSVPPQAGAQIPESVHQRLSDDERQRLRSALADGQSLFEVVARFNLDGFDNEYRSLKEKLSETGEIISTSPSISEEHPGEMLFTILYATAVSPDQLSGQCSFSELITGAARASTAPAAMPTYIRTDLEKLDHLISSTHDLLRNTTNLLGRALDIATAADDERGELRAQQNHIRESFLRVEEELINLRMAELGPILKRAVRAGRAAARSAGKRVHFEVSGVGVPVDKIVAEVIGDPLIHLVRNAVDHGIEAADERERQGKPARGTIRIDATNEGSQSRLRVTDDGRGIDPQTVTEAAWNLGLLQRNSKLDLEKTLRLIFRPGFTTVSEVTDLSGRGVGLDVVESAVEQVGGRLRVSSQPGQGSTFEIVLPVNFGLLDVMVVKSARYRYCVPSQFSANENGSAQLPSVSLRELLGASETASNEQCHLTCQLPDGRGVRLAVDELLDQEEVLVRNLGRHAGRWQGVAGAAELRDGSVALVLDLPRLLQNRER